MVQEARLPLADYLQEYCQPSFTSPTDAAAKSTLPFPATPIVIHFGGSNCGRYAVQFASLSAHFAIVLIARPIHAASLLLRGYPPTLLTATAVR
ncbi:hypothetical protein B0O99DRAFT_220850 [Bisporella sp. PMI_857]|nr:hypothetical protein B0O99DRAFT_220850 [Bisporella sp. PMI_857]